MEVLKIIKKETNEGNETHSESIEMKENIVQKAKALLDDNKELTKRVMGRKWNTAEKEEILSALRGCEVETEETADNFFAATKISNGFPDEYEKREAA